VIFFIMRITFLNNYIKEKEYNGLKK